VIIAASMIRRWRVVVSQPIPRAPLFTWRAVHMDTGRTLRGAATSHTRTSRCATRAIARLDVHSLLQREDARRRGLG